MSSEKTVKCVECDGEFGVDVKIVRGYFKWNTANDAFVPVTTVSKSFRESGCCPLCGAEIKKDHD